MERVGEIGANSVTPSDAAVNHARQALLREIAREERRSPDRRTRLRWIGGSAVVGTLAAGALAIGLVAAPTAVTAASAAEVLEEAAEVTLTTEVLSPAPGQFIRISTVSEWPLCWEPDQPDTAELNGGPCNGAPAELVQRSSYDLYVPADRAADWVEERRDVIVDSSGSDADVAAAIADWERDIGRVNPFAPDTVLHPGGRIMGGDEWETHFYFVNPMQRYYDDMPRDPQALLAWVRDYVPEQGFAPPSLTDPIGFDLAPADLRAAMLRALGETHDARVVSTDGDITRLSIRIGAEEGNRQILDVDTARGLVVFAGVEGADDPDLGTRYTVAIVDAATTDGVYLEDVPVPDQN